MKTGIAALFLALTACGYGLLAEDGDNLIKNPDFKEQKKHLLLQALTNIKNIQWI